MKNYVNVPAKNNKQKNLQDPDPEQEQLVRGPDPRIRIRPNMSRIRVTV